MKTKHRFLGVAVSLVGVAFCVTAVIGFISTIVNNNLQWTHGGAGIRDHYNAVGEYYTQGFTVGFFLCFFMVMTSVSIAAWVKHRRESRAQEPSLAAPTAVDPSRMGRQVS